MTECQAYLTSAIASRSRPDSANEAAILSYCFRTRSRSCSSTVAMAIAQIKSDVRHRPLIEQAAIKTSAPKWQAGLTSRWIPVRECLRSGLGSSNNHLILNVVTEARAHALTEAQVPIAKLCGLPEAAQNPTRVISMLYGAMTVVHLYVAVDGRIACIMRVPLP